MTKKIRASRREFVKKAAYVPPAILTLAVAPSYAKAGSENGQPVGVLNGPPVGVPKGPPVGVPKN